MMFKSYVSGIVLLFSCVIVETAILSNISFLPIVPDLLLISILYMSMKNGRTQGQTLGFFSGLFLDLMEGIPLGFNCIIRTVIGYVSGAVGISLNTDGIFIPAIAGALGILLKSFLAWIISMLFPSMLNSVYLLSPDFLFELITCTILTPIFFKFLSLFNSFLIIENGEKT